MINYRIDFLSSVQETYAHTQEVVSKVARALNMTLDISPLTAPDPARPHSHSHSHSHDSELEIQPAFKPSSGMYGIRMQVQDGHGLEPAPITPAEGKVFDLVAGTTRKVFEPVAISPSGMIANTDTKWDWKLTSHIYRFVPASLELIKVRFSMHLLISDFDRFLGPGELFASRTSTRSTKGFTLTPTCRPQSGTTSSFRTPKDGEIEAGAREREQTRINHDSTE